MTDHTARTHRMAKCRQGSTVARMDYERLDYEQKASIERYANPTFPPLYSMRCNADKTFSL